MNEVHVCPYKVPGKRFPFLGLDKFSRKIEKSRDTVSGFQIPNGDGHDPGRSGGHIFKDDVKLAIENQKLWGVKEPVLAELLQHAHLVGSIKN